MANVYQGDLVAKKGQKFAIIVSRFNEFISSKLLAGAVDQLVRHGVAEGAIDIAWTPGSFEIPEGMHLRMNGPKKLIAEIKAHEGSLIEITGLVRKGQYKEGIPIGGGVRIGPAPAPGGGGIGMSVNTTPNQIQIDVEGWRPLAGACPTR